MAQQPPIDPPPGAPQRPAHQVRAKHLLRVPALWITVTIIAAAMIVLITVFYIGSVVDPVAHLHGLPVSIVNEDAGATVAGRHVDYGAELEAGLTRSPVVSQKLALTSEPLPAAKQRMDRNGAYATLLIPPGFTVSVLALAGGPSPPSARKPTVELLTNVRAGTVGVELATGVLERAVARASRDLGRRLLAESRSARAAAAPPGVLAEPITFESVEYRPLPPNSALGLSAFYMALLTIMCGFLAGTIINAAVDAALGYSTTEIGPRWQQRVPLPISRWQTLLIKWAMALPITALLTGLMLAAAVLLLGMDAPNGGYLWLFSWLAAASVAAGTLVLFAVLGTQGQLIALLLFVYLGLASAGGTVPIEALPGWLKLVSEIEPLRQILLGDRSILYFGAAGGAGLTRGVIAAAAGLVFWLALGAAVVLWYDRKGFDRLRPDVLEYVQQAVAGYRAPAGGSEPAE